MNIRKIIVPLLVILGLFTQMPAMGLLTAGILKTDGSSTVHPVSVAAQGAYETWSGLTMDIDTPPQGSGDGYNKIIAGTTDLGAHSSFPGSNWAEQGAEELRVWTIGMDSIAIIVTNGNPMVTNGLTGITGEQVARLFCKTGAGVGDPNFYETWANAAAGEGWAGTWPSTRIQAVIRVLNSGTHDCFKKYFLKRFGRTDDWLVEDAIIKDANAQLLDFFSTDPNRDNSIGYIGLGFIPSPGITALDLDLDATGTYIEATKDNAVAGVYPPLRWIMYSTIGVPDQVTTTGAKNPGVDESRFISFIMSGGDPFLSGSVAPSNYVQDEGYITKYRADFTSGGATEVPSGDTADPIHPNLPDNVVNFEDIVYFINQGWADYDLRGKLNPYADIDADGDTDFDDIVGFIKGFQRYDAGQLPP